METTRVIIRMLALAIGMVVACACNPRPSLLGDLDKNGHLDKGDLDLLQSYIDSGSHKTQADLNGDGRVDDQDLKILQNLLCQANGAQLTADDRRPIHSMG